ncbi:MAG TPA: tetratricopeptide repeat protein [Polyangia bacterium]|nr:tetratricopeptide repeat protein [Polyangia bacterium]
MSTSMVVADSPPSTIRRDLLVVAGVAIAVRALYFLTRFRSDAFSLPIVDAELFDRTARAFAAGRPTHPDDWFFHGVGYPTILGALYTAFGPSVLAAKAVQLALGVATPVLTYLVARESFERPTALVAGLIVSLYAPLIFLEGELLDAGWTALFSIGLVFTTLRADRSDRWAWGIAWGALAAAAVLTRATFLPYCLLALAVMVARRARASRRAGWAPVITGALTLAVVLFVAAYEALAVSGRFTVLPSSGGLNLYLGNNADQCQTLALRPGLDWDLLERLPRREGVQGIWAENDWFRRRAVHFALHSPASFMGGLARKAGALLVSREIPRNLDVYLFRSDSLVLWLGLWKLGAFGFPFGVLLPLAVLGGVVDRRRVPWAIWLMLGSYAASLIAVFAVGRYRIVLVPALAILAAAGISSILRAFQTRRWSPLRAGHGVALVALMLTAVPWRYCGERVDLRAELTYLLAAAHERNDETDTAEQGYRAALAINPAYFEARHDLGRLLMHANRLTEAAQELRTAASLRPDHVPLLLDLAVCLGQTGQLDESLDVLRRAEALDPNNPVIHNDLGMVFANRRDFTQAAEQFAKAVELDPASETFRANLKRAEFDAAGGQEPPPGPP